MPLSTIGPSCPGYKVASFGYGNPVGERSNCAPTSATGVGGAKGAGAGAVVTVPDGIDWEGVPG
ncbi:hypothetical protein DP44_3198 [Burkholderia pseudomallei]|nr:hypothetical protein DP44_3198 [Burkholderia pseudomallei]KGS75149.1 hypothetical protein X947_5411 [Burkholderia pseudomallei MSHR7334]